ncbi:hypothetical protein CAMGR0001_0869 [Campylobacter gracilis RM3268]|uniref:Uncharacterized protein n=1 Tax=Campylobacter gracilis RM3268 TaxID=553220 RepID=C8PG76_9BACT|nr:hypothetical protein CAMGR0001_0869 [Campylobacter gracilis RM3268]
MRLCLENFKDSHSISAQSTHRYFAPKFNKTRVDNRFAPKFRGR